MKRITQLLLLIILFSGCGSPKYLITSEPNSIDQHQEKKLGGDLPWIFQDPWKIGQTYTMKAKIIFIPKEIFEIRVVSTAIEMIETKKESEVKKYLKSLDKGNEFLPLLNGLYQIHRKQYTKALEELSSNNHEEIQFLVDILMVDCEYESEILNPKKQLNFNYYLDKYQKILDAYDLNEIFIKLINDRIQFARYKV